MCKPSEHCPGGFSFCPRPDRARRCPFALPTWRGFSLAMPCKAFSGFLSGFYSGGKFTSAVTFPVNSHDIAVMQCHTAILPSAWRILWPSAPRFRLRACRPVPLQFPPPWRSACRLWFFPRRQGRAAPHQLPPAVRRSAHAPRSDFPAGFCIRAENPRKAPSS